MTVLADLRRQAESQPGRTEWAEYVAQYWDALLDIAEAAQAFMEAWDEELDDEFRTEEEKFDALRASLARLESPDA